MTPHPIKSPRKLIEVALPLDAINAASAREKSIRHGHPSTLHLWWARRPLAAARAILFAQLVNDPGYQQGGGFKYGKNKKEAAVERRRLFKIIEDLVLWENTTDESVLDRARSEIVRSWQEVCDLNKDHPQATALFNTEKLPAFHDPFAGGGTIPLEAQRLGLEAFASDLNPVAVLINKAMIEIPPKFAGQAPVGPTPQHERNARLDLPKAWLGSAGLAVDVRRYGSWVLAEAQKRIGGLYPPVEITSDLARERPDLKHMVGRKLAVNAWLWTRTVRSPNPAFSHVQVPLISSVWISTNKGKEAWVEPVIEGSSWHFEVRTGGEPRLLETVNRKGATCVVSGSPIPFKYIRTEGKAGRMGVRLMAMVASGPTGHVYLPPSPDHEAIVRAAIPGWKPELALPDNPRDFKTPNYGLTSYGDLFTPRQLVALTTFSDLVSEVREQVAKDAIAAGMANDGRGLDAGGSGAVAYAEAISTYLAFAASKCADYWNTIATWMPRGTVGHLFSKQAIPMTWDYPEANPFADFHCSWNEAVGWVAKSLAVLPDAARGSAQQLNASTQTLSLGKIISTDPPYYDNIGYADLSDFFYVWLRRSLRPVYGTLFSTLAVPKAEELVATPSRHGTKENAELFFLDGMTQAMRGLVKNAHPEGVITIYYAFKQSETEGQAGTSSTGWETFLEAVSRAGLHLTGTWPVRTERSARSIAMDSNALASSIVLVCRKRSTDAPTISRRQFMRELNAVLPESLDEMTKGSGDERSPVAPVDLSQAIVGPGMSVFSKYSAVLEADGSPMSVKTALQLINRFLAEDDFDTDTQFCLHWFQQYGWKDGRFGDADTLARAKGTAVDGVKQAGVLYSAGGVVRLLKWADYPSDWNPRNDLRLPVWEVLHQLIRIFNAEGENGAGLVLAAVQAKAEATRQLAYRLYTLCERSGWAEDARAYNEIVTSWSAIELVAARVPGSQQSELFEF